MAILNTNQQGQDALPLSTAADTEPQTSPVLRLCRSSGGVTNTHLEPWMTNFHELCEMLLRPPPVGDRDGPYFLRGPLLEGFATRADTHMADADLIVLDCDSSFDPETGEVTQGAPSPLQVHIALIEAGIPNVIYSTHSDGQPGKGRRYRVLVPATVYNKAELDASVAFIVEELHAAGCCLADVPENHRMSQPWYFPRVEHEDCEYLCYAYESGQEFDVEAAVEWYQAEVPFKVEVLDAAVSQAKPRDSDSPFVAFNAEHSRDWMLGVLKSNGYTIAGQSVINEALAIRLLSPHSTSGNAGIILFQARDKGWRTYSHHNADDPLTKSGDGVSTSDAWDLFRIFEHNDDQQAAMTAWREELKSGATDTVLCSASGIPFTQDIEKAQPLVLEEFPNQRKTISGQITLPATVANIRHMLHEYGIHARYNVTEKRVELLIPGLAGCPENAENTSLTHGMSLATLNGIGVGQVPSIIAAIADTNQYSPVIDYITKRSWDGTDRLESLFATLTLKDGFPEQLGRILLRRWLISADAAAFKPSGFHARGVFVLQGPQAIGKTSFFRSFIDDPALRDRLIKIDHHLDASNKDSIVTAIGHWIVEIGELDSSFKKDVARLKGFITSGTDKVRRPYDRKDSEYPRRTVFCASVNSDNFLVDDSGNSRWWTVPVTAIDYNHGIDMQQLWAQVHTLYEAGEQWWLTQEEENELEECNRGHRAVSAIRDSLEAKLDFTRPEAEWSPMPATEVLQAIGIHNPTNAQARDCGSFLRDMLGEPTKSKGKTRWRVPLKTSDYQF